MLVNLSQKAKLVNCRIGSLEIRGKSARTRLWVNCRIGSLESKEDGQRWEDMVNCRIGSLEI